MLPCCSVPDFRELRRMAMRGQDAGDELPAVEGTEDDRVDRVEMEPGAKASAATGERAPRPAALPAVLSALAEYLSRLSSAIGSLLQPQAGQQLVPVRVKSRRSRHPGE